MIWAQAHDRVIGSAGTMPWHLPEDLAHFRRTTAGSAVVMGRRTWESLEPRFRPLPGRRNIVLSRLPDFDPEGAEVARDLVGALALVGDADAWVIGGGQVYAQALRRADRLVVTDIDLAVAGDSRAPWVDDREWRLVEADPERGWHTSAAGPRYRFTVFDRLGVGAGGRAAFRRPAPR